MLGAIIGDIVGSRFEAAEPPQPGFELFTEECSFTDDTICTIAIADAILSGKDYGEQLQSWCRRYPNVAGGYGARFHDWMMSDRPQPYGSFGSGAAMRVSPVAWLFDDYQPVKTEALRTAAPTHNHPEGMKGAECIATLCYWLRTCRITRDEVERKVEKLWGYEIPSLRDIYRIGSEHHFDGTCQETVPMAIRCFLESQHFEDAIRTAVLAGGNTGTKANITGALAEAFFEIPEELIERAFDYLPNEMFDVVMQYYQHIGRRI